MYHAAIRRVAPGSCRIARFSRRATLIAACVALLATSGLARKDPSKPARVAPGDEWNFHALVPLGFETFEFQPGGLSMMMMATAESPDFEGWRRLRHGQHTVVLDANGASVSQFPRAVDFRITATTRVRDLLTDDRPTVIANAPPLPANNLLLSLRFRLKIYHGLEVRDVEPLAVKMLGMPADIPYDERIYRASFNLDDVPAEDRIVLEVLLPSGERLCKFHLELL